ncbi:MAG: hypothetical protein Q7T81_07765 [Pseudolabrys sp.]|nr:hypothetical protein [Pseudolabrys sp.]
MRVVPTALSKRNTLRIFVVFLLAIVPVGIGAVLVIFPLVMSDGGQSEVLSVPAMVILAVVQMFAMMLCIAIASRLYEALADRLLHPV